MGFSRRRPGKDGKPRYTAYYRDLRGREASAGTFARKGPDAEDAPIHLASAGQLAAASAVPGLKIGDCGSNGVSGPDHAGLMSRRERCRDDRDTRRRDEE